MAGMQPGASEFRSFWSWILLDPLQAIGFPRDAVPSARRAAAMKPRRAVPDIASVSRSHWDGGTWENMVKTSMI